MFYTSKCNSFEFSFPFQIASQDFFSLERNGERKRRKGIGIGGVGGAFYPLDLLFLPKIARLGVWDSINF